MAVIRPVDLLTRLRQITDGIDQGMSQSAMITEMNSLFAPETAVSCDFDNHLRHIVQLMHNPSQGWNDILEEICIMEELLQTDEYGFREHQNLRRFF